MSNFEGKYSTYDLVNDGEYLTFTMQSYNQSKERIDKFLDDRNMKCKIISNSFFYLVVLIKFFVYSPLTNNYLSVICGIEMLEYFKFTNNMFTTNIFSRFDEKDYFNFTIYIVFVISVIVNLLKVIYEMNLEFQIFVHLVSILHHTINLSIIIFTMI